MNSVFVVFASCESTAAIVAVAVSLEAAIGAIQNKYQFDDRVTPTLNCRWVRSWRYDVADRAFLIEKHYLYSL